jgi:hypothetical protein
MNMPGWFNRVGAKWSRSNTPPTLPGAQVQQVAGGSWCLFVRPGADLLVNGLPAAVVGVRVLAHKDEIICGDEVVHFTTEDPPEVVVVSESGSIKCGRCRAALKSEQAVRCACGVWYHKDCFEYGDEPRCVACRRITRLDGSGLWRPEEEESCST